MGFSWQEYWSGLPFPPPSKLDNKALQQVIVSLWHMLHVISTYTISLAIAGHLVLPIFSSGNIVYFWKVSILFRLCYFSPMPGIQ